MKRKMEEKKDEKEENEGMIKMESKKRRKKG